MARTPAHLPSRAMNLISCTRWLGFAEGWSFLILMGIAMPLKYAAGIPQVVSVVGMAHGILFMAMLTLLATLVVRYRLGIVVFIWGFIAAILPAGPFVFDRYLQKKLPQKS
jgi:integral membrane protein